MAAPCRIQHFKGKNVQWVLCEQCNSWLHVFCEHVTKQEFTANTFVTIVNARLFLYFLSGTCVFICTLYKCYIQFVPYVKSIANLHEKHPLSPTTLRSRKLLCNPFTTTLQPQKPPKTSKTSTTSKTSATHSPTTSLQPQKPPKTFTTSATSATHSPLYSLRNL